MTPLVSALVVGVWLLAISAFIWWIRKLQIATEARGLVTVAAVKRRRRGLRDRP
jgi:hypothetical protein